MYARGRCNGMSDLRGPLELIRDRLNEVFRNSLPREEDWVVLSNVDPKDSRSTENHIVMALANIQRETTVSTHTPSVPAGNDRYVVVSPPLYIDLYVLFYANFGGKVYVEGLGAIAKVISFFQQNPWFTHENLPDLDPCIGKLTFELTNLELDDLNSLMSLAGAKYLPSIYYKVRMIPFQSGAIQAQLSPVRDFKAPGGVKES